MKLKTLVAVTALAFGTAAFAQSGSATATTATPATPAAASTDDAKVKASATTKKTTKAKAKAKKATQSMGAGPASPMTDLQTSDRQMRIDQAYANWKAAAR